MIVALVFQKSDKTVTASQNRRRQKLPQPQMQKTQ